MHTQTKHKHTHRQWQTHIHYTVYYTVVHPHIPPPHSLTHYICTGLLLSRIHCQSVAALKALREEYIMRAATVWWHYGSDIIVIISSTPSTSKATLWWRFAADIILNIAVAIDIIIPSRRVVTFECWHHGRHRRHYYCNMLDYWWVMTPCSPYHSHGQQF